MRWVLFQRGTRTFHRNARSHWHGTTLSSAFRIMEDGFRVGHGKHLKKTGWFGVSSYQSFPGRLVSSSPSTSPPIQSHHCGCRPQARPLRTLATGPSIADAGHRPPPSLMADASVPCLQSPSFLACSPAAAMAIVPCRATAMAIVPIDRQMIVREFAFWMDGYFTGRLYTLDSPDRAPLVAFKSELTGLRTDWHGSWTCGAAENMRIHFDYAGRENKARDKWCQIFYRPNQFELRGADYKYMRVHAELHGDDYRKRLIQTKLINIWQIDREKENFVLGC